MTGDLDLRQDMLLSTACGGLVEVEGQRFFKWKGQLTEGHSGRCSGGGRHEEGGRASCMGGRGDGVPSLLLCSVRDGKGWIRGGSV